MKRMFRWYNSGETSLKAVFVLLIVITLILIVTPLITRLIFLAADRDSCINFLRGQGYYVFSAGDDVNIDGDLYVGGAISFSDVLWEYQAQLDETTVRATGKPTLVYRGVFRGFSLPIWNGGGNIDEQLFFASHILGQWNETSDIEVHVHCYIAQANDNKNFNLQMSWEVYCARTGDVVPITMNDVAVEINTGAGAAAFQSYDVVFTVDYDIDGPGNEIKPCEEIGMRVRRLAASANEIAGEVVITHTGIVYRSNKLGEPAP